MRIVRARPQATDRGWTRCAEQAALTWVRGGLGGPHCVLQGAPAPGRAAPHGPGRGHPLLRPRMASRRRRSLFRHAAEGAGGHRAGHPRGGAGRRFRAARDHALHVGTGHRGPLSGRATGHGALARAPVRHGTRALRQAARARPGRLGAGVTRRAGEAHRVPRRAPRPAARARSRSSANDSQCWARSSRGAARRTCPDPGDRREGVAGPPCGPGPFGLVRSAAAAPTAGSHRLHT